MTPDRPPSAVLSEINYLSSAQAEVVKVASRRNVAALTGFIDAGIADGSVRPCDSEVAAQSILGMLAWGPLSPQWVHHLRGRVFRTRLSAVMIDLLTHGVRQGAGGPFVCPIGADAFLPGRFNAFDRREASEMKVEQLLTAASRLFNRDGVEATSLDEITASLGATKGVLYHYLRDKADLVARCYERAFDLLERFEEAARARGRNGLERMLIGAHLNAQALAGELCPLMPQPGLEALPDPRRAALVARASSLSRVYSRFLRQGVADGSCRPCDTAIVAQMGAGAFGWLAKRRDEADRRTPTQLGDEVCSLFAEGLRAG
jgi:AcrR family transcriptional regulator